MIGNLQLAAFILALRHGWLPDVVQLDCFLPEELRDACVKRDVLVGMESPMKSVSFVWSLLIGPSFGVIVRLID